jgi:hypothetical protein
VTLQLLDFAAHGALGQAQRLRRLGEAAAISDLNQGLQALERGNVTNVIHAFSEYLDDLITLVVVAMSL